MAELRLICYIIAALGGAAMAQFMFIVWKSRKEMLSYFLGLMFSAWSLSSTGMLALLIYKMIVGQMPPWTDYVLTGIAILTALVPACSLVYFHTRRKG